MYMHVVLLVYSVGLKLSFEKYPFCITNNASFDARFCF